MRAIARSSSASAPAAVVRQLGAQEQGAHDTLPGVEALRRLAARPGELGGQELGPDAADDAGGDLVLHREDVVERRRRSARPRGGAGGGVDELGGDPDPSPALRTLPSST